MARIPFEREELRSAAKAYEAHTRELSARTLDVESFWEEESQMLAEFPDKFQSAGCIPDRKDLKCLTKWKWPGLWANYANQNSREDLRRITSQAFDLTEQGGEAPPQSLRSQLRLLTELVGISAATGSVLLTFWRPDDYTVMDQRALSSLAAANFWDGRTKANIKEYPEYLQKCQLIAENAGMSLRNVDRALWYFGD